jgi:hypothetical protein
VKDIGLIHVDVDGIVFFQHGVIDIILDGCDLVVDEQLLAVYIAGKARTL